MSAKGAAEARRPPRLVEQILVKLDEETYARIERIARALERTDPTGRTRSCAAVVRACVARALDDVEADVAATTMGRHARSSAR